MTTKVTVDAHAGWPVRVEAKDHYDDAHQVSLLGVVPAGEVRDFYVFDTRQIIITELKKEG
jgi:hypothetical protein